MSEEEAPRVAMPVAAVSDTLDQHGLGRQTLAPGVTPLVAGSAIVGRAATLTMGISAVWDEQDPYGAYIDYIDGLAPGEVAIISTGGVDRSAVWGELFSAAAMGHGAVGVVTDGYLRDVAKIRALGFAAFGAGQCPVDYRSRLVVTAVGQPVTLGGVVIRNGDLVAADDDGVVVIPAEVEETVVSQTQARLSGESRVLSELLAGESLRAVWERHRLL